MKTRRYGPILKTLRENAGLSQREVGDRLGVSDNYVSLMERDQRPATRLDEYARIFGISKETLDALVDLNGLEILKEDKNYSITSRSFVERMKVIADALGIKLTRLAILLGKPGATFSNLKTKKRVISKQFVADISGILNIPPEEIVDESIPMSDLLEKYDVVHNFNLTELKRQALDVLAEHDSYRAKLWNPLTPEQHDIDSLLLGKVIEEVSNEKYSKKERTQELKRIFTTFVESPNVQQIDIDDLLVAIKM